MNTTFFRDHDGWNGETIIDIDNGRQLVIRTSKRGMGGGLSTTATAWSCSEGGTRRHVMGFGLAGGDYSERLALSMPKRITEKLTRQQHEAVLARLDSIREQVRLHYQAQAKQEEISHAAVA